MIEILTHKISKNSNLKWINVTYAKKKEIEYLKKNFNFNLRNLRDSLSNIYAQRLKIEEYPSYLFLVLRFPVLDHASGEIIASEVDCFIGKNYLITIHNKESDTLNGLFNLCKKDTESMNLYMGKDPLFLLHHISERFLENCFNLLDNFNIEISGVEKEIFSGRQKQSIDSILLVKHNIINFRRIMRSHRSIIKKLISNHKRFVHKNHLLSYNNLLQSTIDIWDIARNHKEMIEALEYTNDSKLSYKMNDIMKTLTIFSVIVFPLTLFAALFGMNTINGMPFLDTENGFWIIVGFMIVGTIGMFGFFKKKRWI
jgi:magnesium transporter